MLSKRGIKRQRSDGLSELVPTKSTKPSALKPRVLVPRLSAPAFTVFNDPNTASQSRATKKARLDAPRLSTKSTNTNTLAEISPIRLVPVSAPTTTAPSLKDRLAFGALTLAAAAGRIPSPISNSQLVQPMTLSPPMVQQGPSQGPSQTAFFTSIDRSLTPKKVPNFPPLLLKSPFRPVFKLANSKSIKPAPLSTIRRPSESTALRRPLAAKDVHRRPSDSYGYGRRPRAPSFMKNLPPPVNKSKLTRDPSLLDALQKPFPRTPPNRNTLKSPSVLPSSEAHLIPPIPHVMMHIDTPNRDAERLVADMSQFSLDPKHNDMISSPVQKAVLRSNDNAIATIADNEEMQFRPISMQSSPGIEVPSQDDSWCRPAVSQSSPIKPIVADSSDPLDMFHPVRFPPMPKRPVARSRAYKKTIANGSSGSSIEGKLMGIQGFKRSNKVYGKRGARRSVYFMDEGESMQDGMDLSEDEILLK